MAASDLLDIWNSALLNATAKSSIASLTEQSAEAAACALRYPSIVRTILRDTDWNCVRRRVALDEVAEGAVWPPSWTYMYVYPADCLRGARLRSRPAAGQLPELDDGRLRGRRRRHGRQVDPDEHRRPGDDLHVLRRSTS